MKVTKFCWKILAVVVSLLVSNALWSVRLFSLGRKIEAMFRDGKVSRPSKVMISLWAFSSVLTPYSVWLLAQGYGTVPYLISPNEVALVPFVLTQPLVVIYTVGWLRKLGFKPWIYQVSDYLSEPLVEADVLASVRWYRPRFVQKLALRAEASRHPARLMSMLLIASPANHFVMLSARLRVGKLLTMLAVALGALVRISLAVWAAPWLQRLSGATGQLTLWLAWVLCAAFVLHGIMTFIRLAQRRP